MVTGVPFLGLRMIEDDGDGAVGRVLAVRGDVDDVAEEQAALG